MFNTLIPGARALLRRSVDLVAPPRCALCGDYRTPRPAYACVACRDRLRPELTRAAPYAPPGTPLLFSLAEHDAAQRHAILALKFQGESWRAQALGALLGEHLRAHPLYHPGLADVVVPVPLHPTRLASRGYNQAGVIAQALAREMELPCAHHLLKRHTHGPAQAQLSGMERRSRRSPFTATRPLRDLRFVLVDDVSTTGVTLAQATQALTRSGARVSLATTLTRASRRSRKPRPRRPFLTNPGPAR